MDFGESSSPFRRTILYTNQYLLFRFKGDNPLDRWGNRQVSVFGFGGPSLTSTLRMPSFLRRKRKKSKD